MVSGVFGMFIIYRKRTASLYLSETAPFRLLCQLEFLVQFFPELLILSSLKGIIDTA